MGGVGAGKGGLYDGLQSLNATKSVNYRLER